MSHEELLRLADEVFWIIIALAWLFGSVCGMLLTFLIAPKLRPPVSDAEDWALRMADRAPIRLDLTLADREQNLQRRSIHELTDEFWADDPTKLRVVK